jgi:hypothetical protein
MIGELRDNQHDETLDRLHHACLDYNDIGNRSTEGFYGPKAPQRGSSVGR